LGRDIMREITMDRFLKARALSPTPPFIVN
jgi:hypothetical protein